MRSSGKSGSRVLHRIRKELVRCVSCRTLVHIEPYPTPNIIKQDLQEILETVDFADEIWFGGWNYNKRIKEHKDYKVFYREQSDIVRRFLSTR